MKVNLMNFQEIINEELTTDTNYILEEGLFKISPAIAYFAFKDGVVSKTNKLKEKAEDADIAIKQKIEKVKAKTIGRSGNEDDDTVYTYTKEQKKFLAQIYKKYGAAIVNQISEFRTNVMAPYNVIKRYVAKNHMSTDKQVLGMTKEEYYRYRESGRRKIEKRGSYFKDSEDMRKEQIKAREALEKAREVYSQFREGNNVDLSATNLEKIFDEAGLGIKKLNGWTQNELATTSHEIERLQNILKTETPTNGRYKISGSLRTGSAVMMTKEEIEYRISALMEKGITNVNGRPNDNGNRAYGSFKDAFSIYMLRREKINEIKTASLNSEYKKMYDKVLKDGINSAQKIYDTKFNNYMGLKGTIELNQYEKKIWKKKLLGTEYSGDINDWELKIKPEDFKGVTYKEKSPKILKAEKDIDRELKRFERSLLKVMSEEDVALCKKYRLFNNFLTVKQLRDPENMFKKGEAKLSNETGDINEKIDSIIEKDYDSIKELEDAQEKLRKLIKGEKLSASEKNRCEDFLNKISPKSSDIKKSDKKALEEILNRIKENEYSRVAAENESKELEDAINDFKRLNGDDEIKAYIYDINKAKDKLSLAIKGGN